MSYFFHFLGLQSPRAYNILFTTLKLWFCIPAKMKESEEFVGRRSCERQHDSLPTDQTFCPRIVAKMWRRGCVEHSYLFALHTIAFLQRMAHSHSCSVVKDCTFILLQPKYRKLTQCSPVWFPNSSNWGSKLENLKREMDTLHLNFGPILMQEKMLSSTVLPGLVQHGC